MFENLGETLIPEKCVGCAVQCDLASDLRHLLLLKHVSLEAAGTLVAEESHVIDDTIDRIAPDEEMAARAKMTLRQLVAGDLEDTERAIESLQQEVADNEAVCDGVLKMRASKGGTTYTVSVCTSPLQYLLPEVHKPTHIQAVVTDPRT